LSEAVYEPIRVLFVEHFGVGGLIHYSHSLCQALAERGVRISLLTASDYELADLPRSFRLLNRLPLWNPHAPGARNRRGLARRLEQVEKGARYLWALCLSLATIRREQPDIVHISEMKFPPDLLLFLLPGHSRVVHTCHNVQRFSDAPTGDIVRTHRLWTYAQSWMYRRCDGVIFHAVENLQEFRRIFGFEPARWAIIPHGEYDLFAPACDTHKAEARQALGLDEDGPLVLFFGAIRRYKGLDVLLEAISSLRQNMPGVRLLVAGAPGRDVDVQALYADARRLGIEDGVVWHIGYVPRERVPSYFYACDVVALPHRKAYESGVLKIAQALGRPVVVTDTGGLASAVGRGRAGKIVPPQNPKALAQALEDLLSDPGLAESLAEYGRVLAHTEFGWDSVAERTARFYREVLGTPCAY